MTLWRITPTARLGDSRWEDHPMFAEVIVRADSSALARLVAANALRRSEANTEFGAERDAIFVSAFKDEKLYRVVELDDASGYASAGAAEVLHVREMPPPAKKGFGL